METEDIESLCDLPLEKRADTYYNALAEGLQGMRTLGRNVSMCMIQKSQRWQVHLQQKHSAQFALTQTTPCVKTQATILCPKLTLFMRTTDLLDELSDKVKRATELIRICKTKLNDNGRKCE